MTVTGNVIWVPDKIHVAEVIEGGNQSMSLQVEKLEKNMAKMTIEASAEELDKANESAYQDRKSVV